MREVHALAVAVHGALTFAHTLGVIYNLRQKNKLDTLVHSLAIAYSLKAIHNHSKKA